MGGYEGSGRWVGYQLSHVWWYHSADKKGVWLQHKVIFKFHFDLTYLGYFSFDFKKLCEFQNLLEKFYLMVLVPSLYDWLRGNGKEAKITIQICKIRQPPIFAKKLQISIKSDFANQLFNFLQECVQKGECFGAYMVPIHEHFFSKISHIHRWHLWRGTKKVQ